MRAVMVRRMSLAFEWDEDKPLPRRSNARSSSVIQPRTLASLFYRARWSDSDHQRQYSTAGPNRNHAAEKLELAACAPWATCSEKRW